MILFERNLSEANRDMTSLSLHMHVESSSAFIVNLSCMIMSTDCCEIPFPLFL